MNRPRIKIPSLIPVEIEEEPRETDSVFAPETALETESAAPAQASLITTNSPQNDHSPANLEAGQEKALSSTESLSHAELTAAIPEDLQPASADADAPKAPEKSAQSVQPASAPQAAKSESVSTAQSKESSAPAMKAAETKPSFQPAAPAPKQPLKPEQVLEKLVIDPIVMKLNPLDDPTEIPPAIYDLAVQITDNWDLLEPVFDALRTSLISKDYSFSVTARNGVERKKLVSMLSGMAGLMAGVAETGKNGVSVSGRLIPTQRGIKFVSGSFLEMACYQKVRKIVERLAAQEKVSWGVYPNVVVTDKQNGLAVNEFDMVIVFDEDLYVVEVKSGHQFSDYDKYMAVIKNYSLEDHFLLIGNSLTKNQAEYVRYFCGYAVCTLQPNFLYDTLATLFKSGLKASREAAAREEEARQARQAEFEAQRKAAIEKSKAESAMRKAKAQEAARLERERLGKERQEAQRREKERLERERQKAECREKERLEKERLALERMEEDRLEKERAKKAEEEAKANKSAAKRDDASQTPASQTARSASEASQNAEAAKPAAESAKPAAESADVLNLTVAKPAQTATAKSVLKTAEKEPKAEPVKTPKPAETPEAPEVPVNPETGAEEKAERPEPANSEKAEETVETAEPSNAENSSEPVMEAEPEGSNTAEEPISPTELSAEKESESAETPVETSTDLAGAIENTEQVQEEMPAAPAKAQTTTETQTETLTVETGVSSSEAAETPEPEAEEKAETEEDSAEASREESVSTVPSKEEVKMIADASNEERPAAPAVSSAEPAESLENPAKAESASEDEQTVHPSEASETAKTAEASEEAAEPAVVSEETSAKSEDNTSKAADEKAEGHHVLTVRPNHLPAPVIAFTLTETETEVSAQAEAEEEKFVQDVLSNPSEETKQLLEEVEKAEKALESEAKPAPAKRRRTTKAEGERKPLQRAGDASLKPKAPRLQKPPKRKKQHRNAAARRAKRKMQPPKRRQNRQQKPQRAKKPRLRKQSQSAEEKPQPPRKEPRQLLRKTLLHPKIPPAGKNRNANGEPRKENRRIQRNAGRSS
ncbi:hypothetical protein [Allobaculum sp. Allo2]|uniref:hypothetical protein n=1 Tax=Allobaculum sp. Allo2 TaxID=2853432 RepID=UPI001F61FB17|nr:hypothetical protein [Allobaculum sp. Allo2]UNT93748.1 hypothetical protein KWG61_03155 [Allobaculum sp. Allo2]